MSRELANLTRNNPHFTPTHILAMSHRHPLANKERRRVVARESVQQWVWTPFKNSARTDRARFYHWEKTDENGVVDPRKDYKFARLNKKIICFVYTDAEYEEYLNFLSSDWTKEQTDELFALCRQFDLRWPVIADRLSFDKSIEQIKDRYYSVARALIEVRANTDELKKKAKTHPIMTNAYDYDHEVKRKQQLERMFARPREEEEKELYIREQLKKIEAIKKRRQEEAKKEQRRQSEKLKKKKKTAPRKNLPTFGAAQIATIIPKKSSTPLVADILSQLDGGVYSRRSLMLFRADIPVERRVDIVSQEYEIVNPLATAKVHEAYEKFRNRAAYMLDLQKQVGKKEAERAMLGTTGPSTVVNDNKDTTTTTTAAAPPPQPKRNYKKRKKESDSPSSTTEHPSITSSPPPSTDHIVPPQQKKRKQAS